MTQAVDILVDLCWALLKYPFYIFMFLCVTFLIAVVINLIDLSIHGKKIQKGAIKRKIKKHNFIRTWFLDVPRRYAEDLVNRQPGFFPLQGCVIFTGRQGRGKTVGAIEFLERIQYEYPLCKVLTNCNYKYQDTELNDWRPLVDYKNGIYGVAAFIDETQNWFASNQSKDFPPEMLQVITQNRKNRRIILGTAQSFNRLAKPIREQATEVRECFTILGCLTFVVKREPFLNCDGDVEEMKYRGLYFFVHTEKIRDAYDTYKVIESLSQSGFQEQSSISTTINNFVINKDKRKK